MEDYDSIPTVLPIPDRPSIPQNACYDCGCYKGKPCGGSSRPIESSEVSFAKEEASTTEATPKASANVTPFVCFHARRCENKTDSSFVDDALDLWSKCESASFEFNE